MSAQPMYFEIGVDAFDTDLLPEQARALGSDAFRTAVAAYYDGEFADLGGTVQTTVEDGRIMVTWTPDAPVDDLFEHAMRRLESGDIEGGLPYLQALAAVEPTNLTAHYNLGMALSDRGDLERAQWHLLKVVRAEPRNANALVALGVALYRAGDPRAARRRLEQALEVEPANGYAHRNLGAVLMGIHETDEGIHHFREAARLLPEDPQSVFGLASALDQVGAPEDQPEADRLYTSVIDLAPHSPIAEMARDARSRIAQQNLRSATGGGPRMDAVMYCLGALETFEAESSESVRAIAYEIATLGRQGLDVNSPEQKYTLQTMPGSFSGLHLMSYMYVAFKQLAPDVDIGFDLSEEYRTAMQMHEARSNRS